MATRAPMAGRVLIVEDETAARRVLRRHLERLGLEVLEATNGASALQLLGTETVDLVLTDLGMPGGDGTSLLEALKRMEATRDVPVIVISGHTDVESVIACIERGAEDHVAKPYEPTLLRARVIASLERKRARDAERQYLDRVRQLIAAAEAVESNRYAPGALNAVIGGGDDLARLAGIFDRMVTGLRFREERLTRRLEQLRQEMHDDDVTATRARHRPDSGPFPVGSRVEDRYDIVSVLGTGGMGVVYHARDVELAEDVAIKVVHRDVLQADPNMLERLKSEIRLSRKVSHPNVVRAHDLGTWRDVCFITMEYVEGITIEQLIDRRGRLTVESTLAIGTQLAEALAAAHDQQIVHLDIKPANLLIDRDGRLKVMDFGIAGVTGAGDALTPRGFIVGTPQYMAPEQLRGGVADERSDMFAMGVVLYECLAGRPPFVADNLPALLRQIADGKPPRVGAVAPGVPAALESLLQRLLAFDPDQRLASAREFGARLSEVEHEFSDPRAPLLEPFEFDFIESPGT